MKNTGDNVRVFESFDHSLLINISEIDFFIYRACQNCDRIHWSREVYNIELMPLVDPWAGIYAEF